MSFAIELFGNLYLDIHYEACSQKHTFTKKPNK